MKGTYIDIRLEGDKFSPKKLKELTNLPLETIAEYGEIARTGRYKGKASPYGMALLKVDGKDEENFNKIIGQYLYLLAENNKKAIIESGVEDIIIDVETSPYKEASFSFSPQIIQEISNLKGRIDFQSKEEDKPGYSLEDWDFIFNSEGLEHLLPKGKARKIENIVRDKIFFTYGNFESSHNPANFSRNDYMYVMIYLLNYLDKEEKDIPTFENFKRKIHPSET